MFMYYVLNSPKHFENSDFGLVFNKCVVPVKLLLLVTYPRKSSIFQNNNPSSFCMLNHSTA